MNYVIKNMGKTKSELEINYGIFLLDKILPLIVKYNKSKKAKMLLYEKVYRNKNNFIYKNKGLFSNLIYNQNIKFENKIEIFKKINSVIKIDLHSFAINTKNISVLLLYLFFNKNECFKLYKNINEGNIYKKIFDDFYYISTIYSEVYFLCDKYHKDNLNIFIQKLDNFFMNNYHDLISDYLDIYNIHDLSEENQKNLVDFIISSESNYIKTNINKEKQKIDLKDYPNKKINKFEIWYCKFILTQSELFYSLLIDINDDYEKEKNEDEKNNSDNEEEEEKEEEEYEAKYTPKLRLTLLRLYLLLKYKFDDITKNFEYISFFNEKIGKNYLINCKEEIFNLFLSIKDDRFVQLRTALSENLESILIFQDENEINYDINFTRINWNIIICENHKVAVTL